jgi:hypothetical protein
MRASDLLGPNEMKRIGASYIQAGLWRGFETRDGKASACPPAVSSTFLAVSLLRDCTPIESRSAWSGKRFRRLAAGFEVHRQTGVF